MASLRIISMVILIIFLSPAALAEEITEQGDATTEAQRELTLAYGALGVVNFTDIYYSQTEFNEPFGKKLGFGGGLRAVVGVHPNLALQPELLYVQRGMTSQIARFPDQEDGATPELRIFTFHYIQLPLLVRAKTSITDAIGVNAVVGPSAMFFLSRVARGADGTVSATDREGVRLVHFGAALGAGVEFAFDIGSLNLDLRYDRSLNSFSSEESIAHTAFSLLVGFQL